MSTPKSFLSALLVSISFLLAASCAESETKPTAKPTVTLTPERIKHTGVVQMHGSGFTPNANALSHLRRPDGTEFPVLPMRTSDRGEFHHEIDTLLLSGGVHEVWVEDETSKITSNMARFEVTDR